ncbi:hypothetical protein [Aminobacter aminovorans]|uniref:hypothetical protein n=1 Tax=Aminobacter TaxID=31988 RepID=UPI002861CA88|nr:hypothetical protein [Aminobacter aminovorans]MDR7221621.1 hypothetical protein [Aminobacter aminovorans]
MLDYIPKSRLIALMEEWGCGKISTEEMSFWCCNNYFPGGQSCDPSVPEWQQSAIEDVMLAFEWQAHDDKITARQENWRKAVEFLNCSEEGYEAAKAIFERDCAGFS